MGEEVGTVQFRVQRGANKKERKRKKEKERKRKNEYKEKKNICMRKRKM
jgi:hypothetical protein